MKLRSKWVLSYNSKVLLLPRFSTIFRFRLFSEAMILPGQILVIAFYYKNNRNNSWPRYVRKLRSENRFRPLSSGMQQSCWICMITQWRVNKLFTLNIKCSKLLPILKENSKYFKTRNYKVNHLKRAVGLSATFQSLSQTLNNQKKSK